jgi:hypothetical protein
MSPPADGAGIAFGCQLLFLLLVLQKGDQCRKFAIASAPAFGIELNDAERVKRRLRPALYDLTLGAGPTDHPAAVVESAFSALAQVDVFVFNG